MVTLEARVPVPTPAITVRHQLSHTSGLPDHWDKPTSGARACTGSAR